METNCCYRGRLQPDDAISSFGRRGGSVSDLDRGGSGSDTFDRADAATVSLAIH